MSTSPETWFAIGGADEDFSGNYGHYDTQIEWCAHRANVSLETFPSSELLQPQTRVSNGTRSRPRSSKHNWELLTSKKKGIVPFSDTFLRFRWTETIFDGGNISGKADVRKLKKSHSGPRSVNIEENADSQTDENGSRHLVGFLGTGFQ